MVKILHFADAHIDMARSGRLDAQSGLPLRVMDFLKALDAIVDAAIQEKVDLVLFCGDAYRDRTPAPTFQREWGKRMKRLSQAEIPTLLVVGNHDLSPAVGRAHALQEYETLEVPFIRIISQPVFLGPQELFGLPLQVIGLPWLTRSKLQNYFQEINESQQADIEPGKQMAALLENLMETLDPNLPAILAAHASVQGAHYGNERSVMLGSDVILPLSSVRDPRLDYAALGHIHKAQDLNRGSHPPVVYPGSIERVDFGEAGDEKYFVIAQVEKGNTSLEWRRLSGRKFFDIQMELESQEKIQEQVENRLPSPSEMTDAIVRLKLLYPREWEALIDEPSIRRHAGSAFEFHFLRQPRLQLGTDRQLATTLLGKTAIEQLDFFWKNLEMSDEEIQNLKPLAEEIMAKAESGYAAGEDTAS
jgi:exonuclease SbcD